MSNLQQENLIFKSQRLVLTPDFAAKFIKLLVWLTLILPIMIMLLPWLQNVKGTGILTAYQPTERIQTLDAPVDGFVSKWHVVEGSSVKAGDVLLEIRDIDPQYNSRLQTQLENSQQKLAAKAEELKSVELQVKNYQTVRDSRVSAANFKREMAQQKVLAATQAIAAAEATLSATEFQLTRMQRLLREGLVSQRDLELAERDNTVAARNLTSNKATLDSAKAETQSALAEISQFRADAQASIDASKADIAKVRSEFADINNSITNAEINVSRQAAQNIVAPRDGIVFRMPVNSAAEVVTKGQPLLMIVPKNNSRAVELMVQGVNAPLIVPGSEVRLQFEGWPAVQVAGWPRVSYGTFAGKVSFVDPTDSGLGKFRVMITPDESKQKWPESRFLRQGSAVQGWILLNEVSLGYEIWRVLNGFPPQLVAANKIQQISNSATKP